MLWRTCLVEMSFGFLLMSIGSVSWKTRERISSVGGFGVLGAG